ncbi:hypothetical protein FH972_021837 [Carpinus fangiana]|uniref:Uncharacterized protein n=1 Tax=Carpinus fangiana TaxID=176857 RepID=A0A5N6KQI0_9ROSI|nr:hypothetical protein FH972_021837 [Carpinus fangiana]
MTKISHDETFREAFLAQARMIHSSSINGPDQSHVYEGNPSSPSWLDDKINTLLRLSNELLAHYENTSKAVRKAQPPLQLGSDWQNDVKRLSRLLEVGYTVTRAKVDAKMMTGKQMMATKQAKKQSEEEKYEEMEVAALLNLNDESQGTDELVKMAELLRDAEKGVKQLTKGLPQEE